MTENELKVMANQIRQDIITGVHAAKSGHPGGSLSAADAIAVLYFDEMNIDPKRPDWPARDRFVLSKGHAAPALYAALAGRGFFPRSDMEHLRQIGSHLQGHPSIETPGVDSASGSLGQGISVACGMALAGRMSADPFRVYTILGDGELEEGQVWEAMMFAGNQKLDNLCIMIDNNGLQIDGNIKDINSPYPIDEKLESFGISVITLPNGNDIHAIREALTEAREIKGSPTAIILKTVKGKGVSFMENEVGWHGKGPNDEEYQKAMEELKKAGEELCQK